MIFGLHKTKAQKKEMKKKEFQISLLQPFKKIQIKELIFPFIISLIF